ncbi:MAG: aminoglycoside phosphotransferase family protein [Defluviitaleaceae bacterium]|nr:aminoglycoside phosphotransferase family protein [Defluviitaleaceae bacterium]
MKEKTYIALSKMLGKSVVDADYDKAKLQGGTLGDVQLLEGIAETKRGDKLPFKMVFKTQEKWERAGDKDSWRREHDLYVSDLGKVLTESFGWPKCYYTEAESDKIRIWMEYVDGVSGRNLTIKMLEKAAVELGRFQGKIFTTPSLVKDLPNFSDTGFLKRDYEKWHHQQYSYERLIHENCPLDDLQKQAIKDGKIKIIEGKSYEYSFLRSEECKIPEHLKQMIFKIDDEMDCLFNEIAKLPVVLCHRDFWVENIIYNDNKISLIDWDTAGFGYLGEDLASLIADDYDFDSFEECCQKLIPAYYNGIAEFMDISNIDKKFIKEMILIKFGYRAVQNFMFSDDDEEREEALTALQKIFEMETI